MHTFTVWAPRATTLEVKVGGVSHSMQKGLNDWWSASVPDAFPGSDYQFVVDGDGPIPDPRSAFQPHGVNGLSRLIDQHSFSWTDRHWQACPLSSAIIYELHIGTFTEQGTYLSAIERLDYLAKLGITHVELMPVAEFSGDWGWGYDGVDLYAPHHAYGTPDELKALVDACHAKGLAVILDVVYNHLGPTGNYLEKFAPYFNSDYHTPWGSAVNFDGAGSLESRRFFIDNALMWLRDYHFDGLRLDAIHAYYDHSAFHFLEQLSAEVSSLSAQIGRHLVLIAESDLNDPRVVTSREASGFGIDAQWSDDFHHALHCVLTGETKGYYEDFGSFEHLAKALKHAFVFNGAYSPHRDRIHGRPAIGLSGHHFLSYAQNHDQIGNRAQGERLSHLVSIGRQKIAAAMVLTSPFIPMLFQGEEFGASSPFIYHTRHEDEELGKAVSKGRRSEFKAFGWTPEEIPDPQHPDSFHKSKLKWSEVTEEPHASLLLWTTELIALRRRTSALTDGCMGDVEVSYDEKARWFKVKRHSIEIVYNLGSDSQAVAVQKGDLNVICSEASWHLRPGMIEVPADSVTILKPKSIATTAEQKASLAMGFAG